MTYNHNEKIGRNLILKARQTDLVHYLREKHPKSIQYASHPDAPDKFCWRGTKHDSITFFTSEIGGIGVSKYFRWSNRESDDGITYLMRYEGYSFSNAVKALAYFADPHKEAEPEISDTRQKEESSTDRRSYENTIGGHYQHNSFDPSLYPDYDPYEIPDGVDEDEEW